MVSEDPGDIYQLADDPSLAILSPGLFPQVQLPSGT
jgi:hypothetical protein